eukprot:m.1216681 g.1216681  ORF g.1216681 m.1216681 type:complete len:52 (+) comp24614_c0_seq16:808-963(+)
MYPSQGISLGGSCTAITWHCTAQTLRRFECLLREVLVSSRAMMVESGLLLE